MQQSDIVSSNIEVEVTRGTMVESRHEVSFAVVNAAGKVITAAGDYNVPVYARSSLKMLQAIPLVETGAADAFGLTDRELSLACASHDGETVHTETVAGWLEKIGCSVDDLECGAHLPYHLPSMEALLRANGEASALHNNCSGKHTGFLSFARHCGMPTGGYIKYEHPVQQRILGVLESMCSEDLGNAPRGADGCGIPVIGISLAKTALGMARMADPVDLPAARAKACERIVQAIVREPVMIAGTDRFCSHVIRALKGRAVVKTGAEGFFCAILPEDGLGIALKARDGATRAAETALLAVLRKLKILDDAAEAELKDRITQPLRNRAGVHVGDVRVPRQLPF
ncbi:asparaginase [Kiloniella sp. b19]|uniref:asparaginase n=1 Tax=Kiloniella sp. GXU_MW_B19 TaxID=3141326 RepID=UPI0031DA0E61